MKITVLNHHEIIDPENYYKHPSMSNSELSKLVQRDEEYDPTEAYAFGNLVDHLITEPEKVDVYKKTCNGHVFTTEQMETALAMKATFLSDDFCNRLIKRCEFQTIMLKRLDHEIGDIRFTLDARCKWDFWNSAWGGDIKTTTAESQKQFEDAARHFGYPRQRFLYMTLGGSEMDALIGISKKKPHRVFKIMIRKGDAFWKEGKEDYERLVIEYWKLYGGI